ncbi:MAG: thiamine-phosphate kinase [Solirubrobacteraceae bacterium]
MSTRGEFELLARIRERLAPAGPRLKVGMGDDAAVTVPGGATATSVDAIVEGVHFRRGRGSLAQIGRRAIAAALSDLAAMGAEPGEAYVVLGVPPDLDEDGCVELLDGVAALAAETGVTLAGGDVTRAPVLVVAMTVVGHAPNVERLVTRAGARAGDAIVLTGDLGAAAAGLLTLERPGVAAAIPAETVARLQRAQLEPRPRLEVGAALARSGATAMIDLSDGLGADAGHIADESRVGLRIQAAALPVAAGVDEVAAITGEDPLQLAISGGEDYELVAALPPERLDEARAAVGAAGTTLVQIGSAVPGSGIEIRLPGGRLLETGGFDQLS